MNAPTNIDAPLLAIRKSYKANPQAVFDAFTVPQALSSWFNPSGGSCEAEIDLQIGGRYSIKMGLPEGEVAHVSGEYLEIEPGRRLAFTWAWAGTPDRVSKVQIDFAEHDEETQITLKHTEFFDEAARDRHGHGWEACLGNLPGYLEQTPRGAV